MVGSRLFEASIDFAVSTLKLCDRVEGHRPIMDQLERSATSIGVSLQEANYAHGRAEFVSKLQAALKECHETEYWLELLNRAELLPADALPPLLHSCESIRRLLIVAVNTAKSKMQGE